MAFPLDGAHIISHLRSSYLVQFDTDEDAKRVLTPYKFDNDRHIFKNVFDKYCLLSSPPIELTSHEHQLELDQRNLKPSRSRKRRSRIRPRKKSTDYTNGHQDDVQEVERDFDKLSVSQLDHSILSDEEDVSNTPDYNDNTNNGLNYTQTIKKGGKRARNIMRMFQRESDKSKLSPDNSEGSIRTTKLEDLNEGEGTFTDATPKLSYLDNQDTLEPVMTLSSKSSSGLIHDTSNALINTKESFDPDQTIDSTFSKDSDSDDAEYESLDEDEDDEESKDYDEDEEDEDYRSYDEEEDDVSSDDSAFTDLDRDSMTGPSLLESFDTGRFSYSKKTKMLSLKLRKKKSRSQSFSSTMQSSKNATFNSVKVKMSTSPSSTALSSLRNKKSNFKFDKVDVPKSNDQVSKLSSLIQSRYKSIRTNPLNYFTFVGDQKLASNANSVELDVFIPPKTTPTIQKLVVNNNVAISDCIGYILLSLSELDEFKDDERFLYPNHWRLELVDEDGENYGSFGILDRTRLLSSYNNPRELAICEVRDEKEIRKYDQVSPLAVEFKQNLIAYKNSESETTTGDEQELYNQDYESISLTITDPVGNKTEIEVDANYSIQELLYDFCSHRNLNPEHYGFRVNDGEDTSNERTRLIGADDTLKADSMLQASTRKRYLSKQEIIKEVGTTTFEIVPIRSNAAQSLLNNFTNQISPMLDQLISPAPNTSIISPHGETLNSERRSSQLKPIASHARKSSKVSTHEANRFFDDMISNLNSGLPGNPKARYFTWKVWRKKTTILNKIEKSLIIDGDYIRLQPPEDKAYTLNPNDNPFLASQGANSHHTHHHHHLYHYNYSNYYNSSMMKTSSFHITQIVKIKQYKNSKNPNHFKIVIEKPGKESHVKKKYDLEAVSEAECEDIIQKLRWVIDVYHAEMSHIKRSNI